MVFAQWKEHDLHSNISSLGHWYLSKRAVLDHRSQQKPSLGTIVVFALAIFLGRGTFAAELQPETVRAWVRYIQLTESRIKSELESDEKFLARESLPISDATKARESVLSGGIFMQQMETRNEEGKTIEIPKGMVHHWLGGVLIRDVGIDEFLEWFQESAELKNRFKQVEDSRLISRDGDVLQVFLRVVGKSIRTVHFNTEHTVEYRRHGPDKASSKSVATKIAQLENVGTPKEREKPLGKDSGYMWRWNAYWRFEQVSVFPAPFGPRRGVILECESISLSRSIPRIFLWLVKPLVTKVPREALTSTLTTMREAFVSL